MRTDKTSIFCAAVFVAAVIGGAAGCGPSLSHTVPDDLLKRLPKSSQRSVYQARTVVTIAIDRKGAIKRKVDNSLREIDRIREKIAEAEKRLDKASGNKKAHIALEITMLEAKIDYLEEVLDHQDIRAELAEWELALAKAQFELSKAQLVKKHSIAFSGDLADFEQQVQELKADVAAKRKAVEAEAAELKQEEEIWLSAKKRYYSAIGESSKGWWTEH